MAKKMKKLLALLLALTLVAGQLTIPAMATEELGEPPVVEGGGPPPALDPVVADSAPTIEPIITEVPADAQRSGERTPTGLVSVISYTDSNTGAQVNGQSTHSVDPSTGVVTNILHEQSVDTDTTTIVGTTTETTTETKEYWQDSTITPIDPATEPDENGFTSSGGTETEITIGEEKTNHTLIQDGPKFPIEESEKTEGKEISRTHTTDTKEKEENIYHNEHTTDNGYKKDEQASSTGTYQEVAGTGSNDKTGDATITQKPGDVKLDLTPGKEDTETIYLDVDQLVQDNIDLPKEGKTTSTAADGTITENEVTYIRNKDGKVIGYTTTRTVISTEVTRDDKDYTRGETVTGTGTQVDDNTGDSYSITYQMPEKPQESTVENPDGSVTVTTVEEITQEVLDADGNVVLDEDGNPVTEVIGYRTNTATTSADGLEVITGYEEIFRTIITTDIDTTTTDVTTTDTTGLTKERVTVTSYARFYDAEGEELVIKDGKWVYKATMSNAKAGENNGELKLFPAYVTTDSEGVEGDEFIYSGGTADGSAINVNTSFGGTWAGLMEIENNGQTFYIYCVDLDTSAVSGHGYKVQNIEDVTYMSEDDKNHIKAVGYYGYWGATGTDENGKPVPGSLQALKNNLTAARNAAIAAGQTFPLSQEQINGMTTDEAVTATQAALWNYGNQGSTVSDTQANTVVTEVMKWLKAQTVPAEMESTDIIEADEFATKASITVKEAVVNEAGQSVTDSNGNRYYNTDVSFTIDVSRNSLTGNLVISVVQNGKTVDSISLADDESNWLGKLTADGTTGTTVKFTNLQLAAGVDFSITLNGTQNLKEGVYIYTSTTGESTASQTFAGLAKGANAVDLSVDMSFTVSEPDVKVKDPGAKPTQVKQDVLVEKKQDTETITNTVRTTHVETFVTKQTHRNWLKERLRQWSYEYDLELYEDDGGNKKTTTILDEDVALADAPKTGDISGLWAAISAMSLGGMALLSIKRKEEN